MKKVTCAEIGGPCGATLSGNNIKELLHNNFIHSKKFHPEIIKQLTKDDGKEWEKEIQTKWEMIPSAI